MTHAHPTDRALRTRLRRLTDKGLKAELAQVAPDGPTPCTRRHRIIEDEITRRAFDLGCQAARAGHRLRDNPYPARHAALFCAWRQGFVAEAERTGPQQVAS
ncbi:hypothetical protein ACVDG3_08750 [Meridianimarinicoccus sp. RP-17]|uniref:hypothetical protein n=1 Tax=Meridianimarinicoccus zhengii TaxID=2056810 RepID=UPI000DAB9D20|nr:hypothetical protein [Phycocomes zhengii]